MKRSEMVDKMHSLICEHSLFQFDIRNDCNKLLKVMEESGMLPPHLSDSEMNFNPYVNLWDLVDKNPHGRNVWFPENWR